MKFINVLLTCIFAAGVNMAFSMLDVKSNANTYHVRACTKPRIRGEALCHADIVSDINGKIIGTPESKKRNLNFREQAACTPRPKSGFSPADLQSAYGIDVPIGIAAGTGPTIAVVTAYDYPNFEFDLNIYRSNYCLPECTVASGCLKKVNQNGAIAPLPAFDLGWNQESALDMQMVSAICPACKILLVVADNALLSNLGTAVNAAAALGELFQNDD